MRTLPLHGRKTTVQSPMDEVEDFVLVGDAGEEDVEAGRKAPGARRISHGGREAMQGRDLAGKAGPMTTVVRRGGRGPVRGEEGGGRSSAR